MQTQVLGEAMSAISERCYYAGWMGGAEYLIPELCRRAIATDTRQPWGHGFVSPGDARELCALAERAGGWVDLDETGVGYERFDPFPIPIEYAQDLDREAR